jgi:hypothetical protein
MLEALASRFIYQNMQGHTRCFTSYTQMFTLCCCQQHESHTNEDKKKKNKKQAYNSRFDIIEHKLIGEVECILGAKQTKHLSKQYFIK